MARYVNKSVYQTYTYTGDKNMYIQNSDHFEKRKVAY